MRCFDDMSDTSCFDWMAMLCCDWWSHLVKTVLGSFHDDALNNRDDDISVISRLRLLPILGTEPPPGLRLWPRGIDVLNSSLWRTQRQNSHPNKKGAYICRLENFSHLKRDVLWVVPQLEAAVVDVQGQVLVVQVLLQLNLAGAQVYINRLVGQKQGGTCLLIFWSSWLAAMSRFSLMRSW